MADKKISALTAATTPLGGTEVFPIVQSSTTVKASIANVQAAPVAAGTANGVQYLDASKVPTTGTALVFDGTNLGVGVVPSTWASGWKSIDIGTVGNIDVNGSSSFNLFGNAYNNGSNFYKATGYATIYGQSITTGQHEWYSAPSGTAGNVASFTQLMTLTNGGNLSLLTGNLVVTNGKGIDFSATPGTGTSELLADYEEGTFTPTLTYSGGNGDLSYSQQIGFYTLVGRCVTFEIRLLFGETTASGFIASINGLPFTSKAGGYAGGGMYIDNMSALVGGGQWAIGSSVTIIEPSVSGTGGASVINATSTGAANNLIQISGLYYV
jgi:hypothetical protein